MILLHQLMDIILNVIFNLKVDYNSSKNLLNEKIDFYDGDEYIQNMKKALNVNFLYKIINNYILIKFYKLIKYFFKFYRT